MTFFEWYSTQPQNAAANPLTFGPQVWEAATLAERERCLDICKDHQRDWNLGDSISPEEIADAIRNP